MLGLCFCLPNGFDERPNLRRVSLSLLSSSLFLCMFWQIHKHKRRNERFYLSLLHFLRIQKVVGLNLLKREEKKIEILEVYIIVLMMEVPELSLAPTQFVKISDNEMMRSSPKLVESKSCSKKRKLLLLHDHHHHHKTSVDLQLKDPLPLDWEQCLDLQSGKMYYLNRKTLRKSWNWPKEEYDHHHHHQKLELELELNNINSSSSSPAENLMINLRHGHGHGHKHGSSSSDRSNMVALPCLNCHLLVILSKSSPSCPNCKHFHTLFSTHSSSPKTTTLPLLN